MARRIATLFSRRGLAVAIVGVAVGLNLLVDYLLIVQRPEELEAQAKRILGWLLPDHSPEFAGDTDLDLLSRSLTLHKVRFHEKGDRSKVLFEVPRLEVRSNALFTRFFVKAYDPEMVLRIDRDGNLNLPKSKSETDRLPADLEVEVVGGRVLVKNELDGLDAEVLAWDVETTPGRPLEILRDLSVKGGGSLRVGALLDRDVEEDERSVVRDPPRPKDTTRSVARVIIPDLRFDLERTGKGPLRLLVGGRALIAPVLRSLIPPRFQVDVWDQLGPLRGEVEVSARVLRQAATTSIDVSLSPKGAAIEPRGFPIELSGIDAGRFEISVALPDEGEPEVLAVTWEGVSADIGRAVQGPFGPERGRAVSRGAVFPGRDNLRQPSGREVKESVTMHIAIDVFELPLSPQLVRAIPLDIRRIYQQFDPQGRIQFASVQLFKAAVERDVLVLREGRRVPGVLQRVPGPRRVSRWKKLMAGRLLPQPQGPEELVEFRDGRGRALRFRPGEVAYVEVTDRPQISVWIPELGGTLSARFLGEARPDGTRSGVPAKLENIHGSFKLSEDANVEVDAEGELELGGTAKVRAQVLHGDLIAVRVAARDVPVSERLLGVLPGRSRELVEPLGLLRGRLDADVRLEKPGADRPAQPTVDATLREVTLRPRALPMPISVDGRVRIAPRFDRVEQDAPSRVDLGLDVALRAPGGTAAVLSGTLSLPPEQPKEGLAFSADLGVRAPRVDLDAFPADAPALAPLREALAPRGVARDVVGRVRGPRSLRVAGRGEGLQATLGKLPYPMQVESFDLSLVERDLELARVSARALEPDGSAGARRPGGTFECKGRVVLPSGAEGEEPELDLALRWERLLIHDELVRALPRGLRDVLARVEPEGRASGELAIALRPGAPAERQGLVELHGVRATLDRLHERLASLKGEPVEGAVGKVRIASDRLDLGGVRAEFLGAPVQLSTGSFELTPAGDLASFRIAGHVERLEAGPRVRRAAGPRADGFFRDFDVAGPVRASFEVFKRSAGDETHVHLDLSPLGMTVVPLALVPVPITDLRGKVKLVDGEPAYLDLRGKLDAPEALPRSAKEPAPAIVVQRDRDEEWRFPGGGRAGRTFHVTVEGFRRYAPGPRREAFERLLPARWREHLDNLEPEGALDADAWFHQPLDPAARLRWVAEGTLKDFGFKLRSSRQRREGDEGIAFTRARGTACAAGGFGEFQAGTALGEVRLQQIEWKLQAMRDLVAAFGVEQDGTVFLGRPGAPFATTIYGGDLRGIAEYNLQTGAYRGWLGLAAWPGSRPGRLGEAVQEWAKLRDPPKKGERVEAPIAYTGKMHATLSYAGGGLDLAGRPRELLGRGELHLADSNLADAGFLRGLVVIVEGFKSLFSLSRDDTAKDALRNLHVDFRLHPERLDLKSLDVWGPTGLRVHGEDGTLTYSGKDAGQLEIDLVLGRATALRWIPGVGYRATGKVQKELAFPPIISPFSTIKWLADKMQRLFGGEEPAPPKQPAGTPGGKPPR